MKTLPIGIISVILITLLSIDRNNIEVYLNSHSFVLVFLGTLAVFTLSTPQKGSLLTLKAILNLFKKDFKGQELKEELVNLKKNTNNVKHKNPLIDYALKLWQQGVDQNNFEDLLTEKLNDIESNTQVPVSILKNLSKYPPALGMIGTVMGMIALFANLNSENKLFIGQALSVAMTATFYGLMLANMIILPLADRLQIQHQSTSNRNELIFTALLKINKSEPVSFLNNINLEEKYYEQAG